MERNDEQLKNEFFSFKPRSYDAQKLAESDNQKIVGWFYIVAFNGQKYEFFATEDKRIYFSNFEIDNEWLEEQIGTYVTIMRLKPIISVYCDTQLYKWDSCFFECKKYHPDTFIKEIIIPEELEDFMVENNMLCYSTDMAYFYDLKNKSAAFDYQYNKRAFKHTKGTKILVKQKQGKFN